MHIIGFRSFWLPLIVVTGLSALVCLALSGRRRGLRELQKRKARLTARLKRLQDTNQELRARRNALLSSLKQIERVAREKYGYRGKREYVRTIKTRAPATSSVEPAESINRSGEPWWARFLRPGHYPWRIPVLVAGMSFFVIPFLNALGASEPTTEDEDG